MTLDARSILLTSTAVSLILTVIMLVYWKTRKVYAGFKHWLWGDGLMMFGYLLLALRGNVPDFASVIIGNFLIVLAMVVLHQGIRRFFGEFSQDKINITILIFFGLLVNYYLYVDNNIALRIVFVSFVLSFLLYRSGALLLFKAPEELKKSAAPGSLIMWATSAFFFVRGLDVFIFLDTYDVFSPRWINVLSYMMGAVLVSAWTFGFFFLNSTRLELELGDAQNEMKKLALTDSLTGIFNRRHFFEHARLEFERARRYQGSFSVLVIDADHFKNINDQYGHAAGDKALREIACVISGSMRTNDTCARLGGEEFGILLLEIDETKATETAERIRSQLEQKNISFDGQKFNVTVSIGVAVLKAEDKTIDELLHRADQALYRAKEKGRNRVSD